MSTWLSKRVPDDVLTLARDEYQGIMHWHRESLKLRLRIGWQFVIGAWQVFMKEPTWGNYFKYAEIYAAIFRDHNEALEAYEAPRRVYSRKDAERMVESSERWQRAIEKQRAKLAADDIPDF